MSLSSWIPTFVSSTASSLFASISVPSHTPLVPSSLPQDILLEEDSASSDPAPEETLFRKSFDPVVASETEEKPALKITFEEPSISLQPPVPTISVPSSPPKAPPPPPSISLSSQEPEELEDDTPPPFPLLDSHQRSSAPSTSPAPSLSVQAPPSFTITPPTALRSIDDDGDDGRSSSLGAGLGGGGSGKKSLATPTTTTKVVKARGKVGLSPGHSPLDWARVKSSGRYDGRSLKGDIDHFPIRVTPSLLKEHNGRNGIDAWSAYQGRVYNITPYMKFHPGGEKELMRSAGRDGTKLFMATHAWVNMDMMMDACLVGMMVPE